MSSFSPVSVLFVLLCQFSVIVWGSASLVPPSTFPPTSTMATLTGASTIASSTTSQTATVSGTGNATTSGASTSTTQFPSLGGVSSCVSGCLASAIARVNCTSITDVNCFCVQPHFPNELVACILANCADQVSTSENLAQQFCNIASSTPTLTFESVPSTTAPPSTSTTDSSSTSTSPSSTTSPSSASSMKLVALQGLTLTLLFTTIGAAFGAFIIL